MTTRRLAAGRARSGRCTLSEPSHSTLFLRHPTQITDMQSGTYSPKGVSACVVPDRRRAAQCVLSSTANGELIPVQKMYERSWPHGGPPSSIAASGTADARSCCPAARGASRGCAGWPYVAGLCRSPLFPSMAVRPASPDILKGAQVRPQPRCACLE